MAQVGFAAPLRSGHARAVFARSARKSATRRRSWPAARRLSSSMETLNAVLAGADRAGSRSSTRSEARPIPEERSALATSPVSGGVPRARDAPGDHSLLGAQELRGGASRRGLRGHGFDEATIAPAGFTPASREGAARSRSRGEHGLPEAVLRRAREILGEAWRQREGERVGSGSGDRKAANPKRARPSARMSSGKAQITRRSARPAPCTRGCWRRTWPGSSAPVWISRGASRGIARPSGSTPRGAQASAPRLLARAESGWRPRPVIEQARDEALARTRAGRRRPRSRIRGSRRRAWSSHSITTRRRGSNAGKRMRVGRSELQQVARNKDRQRQKSARPPSPTQLRNPEAAAGPAREINLIGQRIRRRHPAPDREEPGRNFLSGTAHIRIVHGHGTRPVSATPC